MKTQKIVGFEQGPTSSGMMTWYCAVLACGHNWYDPTRSWAPIKGISANIGDDKECERCKHIAESVERLTNLDVVAEHINYFRFKPQFGGQYHAYKLDSSLAGAVPENPGGGGGPAGGLDGGPLGNEHSIIPDLEEPLE